VPELTETLKSVPLFAGVSDSELGRIAERMSERTVPQGQAITAEGESGIGFFVIEDGTATVSVGGETVRTLGAGDHFGDIALIDGGPRSATIVADTDLRCRGMTAWEFRPLVQEHPEMAWTLLETLASRLRQAEQRAQA
jgi:CRP/FNR family cyclic AMP-dependent transcriptional regulator